MAGRKRTNAAVEVAKEVKTPVEAVVEKAAVPKAPAETAKPVAKKGRRKAAEKPAAPVEKAPVKKTRAPRKPKALTIDDIVAKIYAKADKAKAKKIEGVIAADVEVYGSVNAHLYIAVKDGELSVEPYAYEDYTFRVAVLADDALAFVNGKLTLAEAFEKSMYAEGNIGAALKIASLF